MSTMRHAAQDYLALRRSLGYKLESPGRLVGDFARYLDARGLAHVTVDAALAWAVMPGGSPYWHWSSLARNINAGARMRSPSALAGPVW